jgi:hypothetical protein
MDSPFTTYFADWFCEDPDAFTSLTPVELDPVKSRMRSYVMKKAFLPPLRTSRSLDTGKKLKDLSNRHLSTAGVLHVPSRTVSFSEKIVKHYYVKEKEVEREREKEMHIQSSPSLYL